MSLGILFPGQGSQKVGMLEEFISKYPIVSQTFEEASDILSTNLLKIIKKGPVEKINDTEARGRATAISSSLNISKPFDL